MTSVYIGVVGSEMESGICRDSIQNLNIRQGDNPPQYIRSTKGFEGRQTHIDFFLYQTQNDAILLLDGDMVFAPDTLERLRSHNLPYITGYYMRRMFQPVAPVWYEYPEDGSWPQMPMMRDPERGVLHRLGGSGWGCILIHRNVFKAVRPLLKGESFVIEDDMDIWPYDLPRVMQAINSTRDCEDMETLKAAAAVMQEEIRPLTGNHGNVGSDVRFPFFAREAGFDLWGDPDVRPGHVIQYPISGDDYSQVHELQDNVKMETIQLHKQKKTDWNHDMKILRGEA